MFDKETFGELLIKIQGKRSINTYAKDSGVSAAYISKLQRGLYDKAPSPNILHKLADSEEVSYADLMVAAGHILPFEDDNKLRIKRAYLLKDFPIYKQLHPNLEEKFEMLTKEEKDELDVFMSQATPDELMDYSFSLSNLKDLYLLSQGEEEAKAISNPSNMNPIGPRTVRIPILGKIACGDPISAEENIEGYIYRSAEGLPNGELMALKVQGDSMEPTIPDKATVLIRLQPDVENGEMAAVMVNGNSEATLKRVKKQGNTIILMPDNPKHEPFVITKENSAQIIGKVMSYEVHF